MKRLGLLFCVSGVATLSLAGCMTMEMHGMHHGASHQGHQSHTTVVEELRAGDVTVALEVPPVTVGRETALAVRVSRAQSGVPVAGAKVVLAVQPLEPTSGESAGHADDAPPVPEYQAEEATEQGTYQLEHTFADVRRYRVTARVWIDAQDQAASPLVLTATVQAVHQEEGGHNLMGLAPMSVASGIGMALMMSVMMGRFLF